MSQIEFGVKSKPLNYNNYSEILERRKHISTEIEEATKQLKDYCDEKGFLFKSIDLKVIAAITQEIAELYEDLDQLFDLFPTYNDLESNMTLVNIDEYERLLELDRNGK